MELQDWIRPHYVATEPGGEPFLFYVVYGTVDLEAALSRETFRSEGIPDGIDVMHYTAGEHANVLNDFREGYLWDELVRTSPELARQICAATECVIVRGTPADASNLNYLRDVVGLLTHFLDHGGCCVFDPQMFEWWAPEVWRERIFAPAEPAPNRHVTILTSAEETAEGDDPAGALTWFHTRGMRKFGRPDLSVHDVAEGQHVAIIEMINRFIEMQAFGAVIPEGQAVRMASLPEGMTCHHGGDVDDPEFNNVHVEIRRAGA